MNTKIQLLTAVIAILIGFSMTCSVSAEERYITTTDGVKLHVKISGKGLPCLFVHGGPGQGSLSFEQMGGNNLEKYLTIIYLDQRGSGRSESATDYGLSRMLKDIEEVRKALGYEKINLLSHSFGGVIAVNYAKKYAERVTHLILSNSVLHFYGPEILAERIKSASKILGMNIGADKDAEKKDLMRVWHYLKQELNNSEDGYKFLSENRSAIQKMIEIDNNSPRNLDFGKLIIADPHKYSKYYADYTLITHSINIPVLVITGETDYAGGIDHYRSFRFPKQTVKALPGGHLPYYDQTDLFVRTINDFVNGH
jgi:proline iminopeptidase